MYNFKLIHAPIGAKVIITGKVEFYYDTSGNRSYEITQFKNKKFGQLSGKKRICMGKFIPDNKPNFTFDENFEPAYLAVSHQIIVYLVRLNHFSKEFSCLEYQLTIASPHTSWKG